MIEVTEERLRTLATRLGYECFGEPSYGWHQKSVGMRARRADSDGALWVKLISETVEKAKGREWEGEADAGVLRFPFKPALVGIHDRTEGDRRERLLVTSFARDPVAGSNPWTISVPDFVDDRYLSDLSEALRTLSNTPTQRVNTRFDLVRRRLAERWNVPVTEEECAWETVHGDLHWSNLTLPSLHILDWEGWGRGLVAQDIATLKAFSGLYPVVAQRLDQHFALLRTRTAQLAIMFVTAELLRMSELYGDHLELVPSLQTLGGEAKNAWAR